jgi:[ribosomal protein S18]-alanine N-acetyltransferase
VLTAEWKEPLLAFFRSLVISEDTRNFQPHAFTQEAVERIMQSVRRDLYYVLVEGRKVLGYGMLRGWDEGYEVPSLGIAIHPSARGTGLGKLLMQFLAEAAKRRGAEQVRLRVKIDNDRARGLYEKLGYKFGSEEDGYLVGYLQLKCNACGQLSGG